MRLRAITGALASLLAALAPAWAGDRLVGVDRFWPSIVLPPPADTGKPALPPMPNAGARKPGGCASPLPCGARLLGTARRNGAVEFQIPALRW
jgi:hypothetical protein